MNQWQELISQGIEQALRLNFERISPPQNRIEKLLKVSEEKGSYNINSETQLDATSCQTELGILEIKAIAQVLNTYIIAEHSSGLWLIEQHIAHERILYEQICDQWRLIPLEPSIILQSLSTAQLEQMQRLGLEVDPFGDGVWVVRNALGITNQT